MTIYADLIAWALLLPALFVAVVIPRWFRP